VYYISFHCIIIRGKGCILLLYKKVSMLYFCNWKKCSLKQNFFSGKKLIKKVVRTVLFVNEFAEFSYSCYKDIIYWRVLVPNVNNSRLQNDKDIRLYTCITFHFFALALGVKGVFYSYKKISMLHLCNWKKNAIFLCLLKIVYYCLKV
jgi:hypothetical protein